MRDVIIMEKLWWTYQDVLDCPLVHYNLLFEKMNIDWEIEKEYYKKLNK